MTESNKTTRRPRHLPDPTFISTTVDRWGGRLVECRDLWDGYSLHDAVLDSTPLKKCQWATLFAYMHRRFGLPHMGGDDYKDLSASWMLTTPDREVFVRVNPSLSGPGFSLAPYLLMPRDTTNRVHRASELNLPTERVAAIRKAYRTALLDLLRPVCVRDSDINALGVLGDSALDQALMETDEDEASDAYKLRFHPSCGYSMPLGLFGGNDWPILCSLIRHLGDGDMEAGRAKALEVLQRDVYGEAAGAGWQVHRLMLLSARNQRGAVAAGLGLVPGDVARFDAELKSFHDRESTDRSIADEMTDAVVNSASDFLKRLGLPDMELGETVNGMRLDKAVSEAWAELVAIAKDDFPDNVALPEPYPLDGELPVQLKATFNAIGRTDLADWVEKTAARPQGLRALADITFHLSSQAKEHQNDDATGFST